MCVREREREKEFINTEYYTVVLCPGRSLFLRHFIALLSHVYDRYVCDCRYIGRFEFKSCHEFPGWKLWKTCRAPGLSVGVSLFSIYSIGFGTLVVHQVRFRYKTQNYNLDELISDFNRYFSLLIQRLLYQILLLARVN